MLLFESSDITFQGSDVTFSFLEYIIYLSSEKKFRIICVQLYALGAGFQINEAFLDVRKTFLHRVIPKSLAPGTLLYLERSADLELRSFVAQPCPRPIPTRLHPQSSTFADCHRVFYGLASN